MTNSADKIATERPGSLSVSYKSNFVLNEFANAMHEAVITANPDFIITGLNPVAESIYGLPLKNAVGKSLFELIRFDLFGTTLSDAIKQLFDTGFWSGEVAYHSEKNQKLYFDTRCSLLKNEQGNVSSIVLVNNNISDKIRQQRELLQVENKYHTVFESLSEGVLVIRNDGRISTANKKAIEMLGLSKDEAAGKVVISPKWKAVDDEHTHYPLSSFPSTVTLQTGIEKTDEIVGIELPGQAMQWFSINSRAIYKEGNHLPDSVILSFKDITAIKKAGEKLKESEELFRCFMAHSHNLGWVYDEHGNLIYGNPVLMETVGLSEQSIGKNIYDITNKRVAAAILEKNKKVLATGEAIISEDQYIDSDGNTRYFIAHYFLLSFGDHRKFVGGHSVDITERKKIESQLINVQIQKQKQIIKATLAAQEQERNRISLELHDNVNQLLMSAKLHIGAGKKSSDNQLELLDKAEEYLLMAVEEIRSLSKSLNSSLVTKVGLKNAINDIVKNLENLNDISIEMDIAETMVDQLTDEQQLMIYRIVQEQSNNIIKYSSASKVSITLKKINKYCQLIIADNGKGFDQENTQSNGIGLKNILNRADAHNGFVKIESSPGNGCKLSVRFPFAG